MPPSACGGKFADASDRGFRDHSKAHTLRNVWCTPVEAVQHRRAHWTRMSRLWAVHIAVHDQRVLTRLEQLRQPHVSGRLDTAESRHAFFKFIVGADLASKGQC